MNEMASQIVKRLTSSNRCAAIGVRNGAQRVQLARMTLVRSVLLPVATYGLAFWRPTQQDFAKLQSLVVMPLRIALGLPRATATVKVLAEYGLPTLRLLREFQLLAYGERCAGLQPPHPAATFA